MELLLAPLCVIAAIVLIPLLWFIGTYNGLVRLRQHMRESWSGIDTELKRRYDLIPNLVATVKGYAAHESDTLERVIQARQQAMASHGTPEQQAADENILVGSLRQLIALREAYPDLKANQQFLALQRELANTEDRIQAARRFYNANVRDMNTRIEVFPSNVVANMFKFERGQFFEIDNVAMREAPAVNLS